MTCPRTPGADKASGTHRWPSRIAAALALALLTQVGAIGCLTVEHGIVVELRASALASGAARQVRLHDGTDLTIETGDITIRHAELLVCRGAAAWLDEAARVLLGPARALAQHDHDGSPFALRGPFRVSLVSDAATLGAFTPPPGTYCGVHVELGPAADEGDRPPWTIALRARTADGASVVATSDGLGVMHLEFDAPLVLARRGTTILTASFYEATTFARLPALIEGEAELGAALLRGVSAQGSIRVEPSSAP